MANAAAGVTRSSQSGGARGQDDDGEQVGKHDRRDDRGDRPGAAAQQRAEREREHRGDREQRGGPGDGAHLGERGDRQMKLPLDRSSLSPARTAAMDRGQPGEEGDRADHDGLGRQDLAPARAGGKVTRIRPRRYSAVMNITATTITAISPANRPVRVCSRRCRAAAGGHVGRDVTGAVHGERSPRPGESPCPVTSRRLRRLATAARALAGDADVVEAGGGHRGRAVAARPAQRLRAGLVGARGCGEQPGLRVGRQSGQAHGPDHAPAAAVGGVGSR